MAADVSYLVRILNGYKDDGTVGNESASARSAVALMTRDLLGVYGGGDGDGDGDDQSQELDLDLQVPTGWEKRLDLKSGKVYLQRCNSSNSPSTNIDQSNQTVPRFQDLNFPPTSTTPMKPLLNLFDDTNLELKLLSSSTSMSSSSTPSLSVSSRMSFQSVCTLDKVKSALERVERDPLLMIKKRPSPSSSSSMKDEDNDDNFPASSPVAAGCPGCLSYVLVLKNNPKCPRCNSFVPLPAAAMKKHKIDLNISI